jgi:hypothetical protein
MKSMTQPDVFAATLLLLSLGSAFANERGLPADRMIAAIETAVAANPGRIQEVGLSGKAGD